VNQFSGPSAGQIQPFEYRGEGHGPQV
jgi:hypothetical protein